MKMVKRFLIDQIRTTILYVMSVGFIIFFYVLTIENVEITYPVFVAIFFYLLWLVLQFISYMSHHNTIIKLEKNVVNVPRANCEYEEIYNTFLSIHSTYHKQIAQMEAKNRQDKRLISAFVHNLKTPVTVSSIIVQRALTNELPMEQSLQDISQEIERLNSRLNLLLEVQRLEELEKDYEPQRLSLSNEVTTAINANKSLFIQSQVYPKFEEDDVLIYTDHKWNQVILNQIISNAVKYSKKDTTQYLYFYIETKENTVTLSIHDQGIGIPEYDIPRVFEAFFTGENGRKGYDSSGIGLYLCKEICSMLNQKISIENDRGCKVTITYLTKL